MTILIYILLALNFAVPLLLVRRCCLTRDGIEVNHVLLFSLGFFTYWVLPISVGMVHLFEEAPAMSLWYQIFDSIPEATLAGYLAICLLCYLCFGLGVFACGSVFAVRNTEYRKIPFDLKGLIVPLLLGIIIAGVYAFLLRDQLFKGYTVDTVYSDADIRGAFTGSSTFLLSLAVVYTVKKQEGWGARSFTSLVLNPFAIAYLIVAVLVVSLGGRLYLLSAILMLLVYRTVYFQRFPLRTALILSIAVVGIAGLTGLGRQGSSFSIGDLVLNLFLEPLFNSFSLIHFLAHGSLEFIKFPIFLVSNLVNLVPTALFPSKGSFMVNPEDFGYTAFSPVGALNSFFSFMINFGVAGTMLVFFLFSIWLQKIKTQRQTVLSKTLYIMISGWLATSFFRDPFAISLVKVILQFSILVPLSLVLGSNLVFQALHSLPRKPGAALAAESNEG